MKVPFFPLFFILFFPFELTCQWSVEHLPSARVQAYGSSGDLKAFLVGGIQGSAETAIINTYNIVTNKWNSVLELTEPRSKVASVVYDNYLITGGGISFNNSSEKYFQCSDIVEIYNHDLNVLLKTEVLSQARTEISAVSVGNKVLFAGGIEPVIDEFGTESYTSYSNVDVLNVSTLERDTLYLSEPRGGMAHAVVGNKAYFAGGFNANEGKASNRIDIYDSETGNWSTDSLSVSRAFYGNAAVHDGKIYFAGGIDEKDSIYTLVDILDTNSGEWETMHLSVARFGIQAATLGDEIFFGFGGSGSLLIWRYFFSHSVVDILDAQSGEWSSFISDVGRFNHYGTSLGNQVMFIGGSDVFEGPLSRIDIYRNESISSISNIQEIEGTKIYPNPTQNLLTIESRDSEFHRLQIYNVNSALLLETNYSGTKQINLTHYANGQYIIRDVSETGDVQIFQIMKY